MQVAAKEGNFGQHAGLVGEEIGEAKAHRPPDPDGLDAPLGASAPKGALADPEVLHELARRQQRLRRCGRPVGLIRLVMRHDPDFPGSVAGAPWDERKPRAPASPDAEGALAW